MKARLISAFALSVLVGLTAVQAQSTAPSARSSPAAPFQVMVTSKPIHSLVAQVMADVGTPGLMISGTQSPHTYAAKPSDAKALQAARVVFRISAGIEPFTEKMFKALPASVAVVTLADAKGLRTLPVRSGATFEKKKSGHSHGHEHDHAPKAGAIDGHVWLDPLNAQAMVDAIAAALTKADAPNAARYATNAAAAKVELQKLDEDLARALKPVAERPLIVLHDAYQYLETRYGLSVAGSIQLSPEVPPSGKRLSEVRAKLKTLKAACVFREPNVDTRVVDTVTEGTSAKFSTFDPEATALEPGPKLYDTMMRGLAASIVSCVGAAS